MIVTDKILPSLPPAAHSKSRIHGDGTDPPPYPGASTVSDSGLAESTSTTIVPPVPATNHLRINRDNHWERDVFVLDPSLPVPENGCEKTLELNCKHGPADARVYLQGTLRAELDVKSERHSAKISICYRAPTVPISLVVTACHGAASVYLPRDFRGPLKLIHRKNGQRFIVLEPSLAAVTRTFEEKGQEKDCWVGEWDGNSTGWEGDDCTISSEKFGVIRVGFHEPKEDKPGFFHKVFRH